MQTKKAGKAQTQSMIGSIAAMNNVVIVGANGNTQPRIAMALDAGMDTFEQAQLLEGMFTGLFLMYAGISHQAGISKDACHENAVKQMTAAISAVYAKGVNIH